MMFKLVFLTVFMVVQLEAQESISDTIKGDFTETWIEYVNPSCVKTRNFSHSLIAELLELYDEYETQCCDDSTLVETIEENSGYVMSCLVNGCTQDHSEPDYLVIRSVWVENDPTFRGFMQYLRNK